MSSDISPQKILQNLNEYRKTGKFCDIVIQIKNKKFPCHRAILVGALPYFSSMLGDGFLEGHEDTITLKDVDSVGFNLLLDYIYGTDLVITENNVKHIYPVASYLGANFLAKNCMEFIFADLHRLNIVSYYIFAVEIRSEELLILTRQHVQELFSVLIHSEEFFQKFSFELLQDLISDDYTYVDNEKLIFEAVLKWVHFDLSKRSKFLLELMKNIRFHLIESNYVNQAILKNELIKNSHELKKIISQKIIEVSSFRKLWRHILMFGYRDFCLRDIAVFEFDGVRTSELSDMKLTVTSSYFQTCLCNDLIYCLTYSLKSNSSTMWYFTPGGDRNYWSEIFMDGMTTIPVYNLVSLEFCNTIFANTLSSQIPNVYSYSTYTRKWTSITPPDKKVNSATLVADKNLVYTFGGVTSKFKYIDSAEKFDPRIGKWITLADVPQKIAHTAGVCYNNRVYITGGYGYSGATNTVNVYDIRADKWTFSQSMQSNQLDHCMVSYQDKLYLIGGKHSRIHIYDPIINEWEVGQNITDFNGNRFVATVY